METNVNAAATVVQDAPVTVCSITNNSGRDIVVILLLFDFESTSKNSILSYNHDFELLPVSKGGNVIKNGDTDTIILHREYDLDGTEKPETRYDLLIATAGWLSPLSSIRVVVDVPGKPALSQTITAEDVEVMKQTYDFYQAISANPEAVLAKAYVAALSACSSAAEEKADGSDNSSQNSLNAIGTGIATFFAATKCYRKVTEVSIATLETYFNYVPFVWTNYASNITYNLYAYRAGSTSFVGNLAITKPSVIDVAKRNCGFTAIFSPAVNHADIRSQGVDTSMAITLTYTRTIFVDNVDADMPGIALKGSFQLKKNFTKNPADTQVIKVLCGSVGGMFCLGFDASQSTTEDNTMQDWLKAILFSTNAGAIFNCVLQVLGAKMMLRSAYATLCNTSGWLKDKISAGEPVTKADLQDHKTTFDCRKKAEEDSKFETLMGKEGASTPPDPNAAQAEAAVNKSLLGNYVNLARAQYKMVKIKELVSLLAGYLPGLSGGLADTITQLGSDTGMMMDAIINSKTSESSTLLTQAFDTIDSMLIALTDVQQQVLPGETVATNQFKAAINTMKQERADEEEEMKNEIPDKANPDLAAVTSGLADI